MGVEGAEDTCVYAIMLPSSGFSVAHLSPDSCGKNHLPLSVIGVARSKVRGQHQALIAHCSSKEYLSGSEGPIDTPEYKIQTWKTKCLTQIEVPHLCS